MEGNEASRVLKVNWQFSSLWSMLRALLPTAYTLQCSLFWSVSLPWDLPREACTHIHTYACMCAHTRMHARTQLPGALRYYFMGLDSGFLLSANTELRDIGSRAWMEPFHVLSFCVLSREAGGRALGWAEGCVGGS